MSVWYGMGKKNLTLQSYSYGFIDLIKDVGGFLFAATILASLINAISSYNKRMNWAVSELFQKKSTGKWMPDGEKENLKYPTFTQSAIKDICRQFCCCLNTRKNRQDRIFNAGRKGVNGFINILHYVRFVRFMERVIQARIPAKIQSQLHGKLRRTALDSFSEPSTDSDNPGAVKSNRNGDEENDSDTPQLDVFSVSNR